MRILLTLTLILFSLPSKANNLECLVEAVYHEARSEGEVPQIAVANVILQRVKDERYPNTVCEVVHEGKYYGDKIIRNRCQFSYYCDGKDEKYKDSKSLLQVLNIASLVLEGVLLEQTMGATHYHAYYVKPHWSYSDDFKNLGRVGSHIFYIDNSNK